MSTPAPTQRAAFLVTPHMGGTFSVFLILRTALARLNIELEWVGFSNHPDKIRSQFPVEFPRGRLVDSTNLSSDQLGAKLLEQTIAGDYQFVFINVLTSTPEMSIAAYLPRHIKRIMIVHSITPGTYSGAKAVAPYVHAAVGVSPRIERHLVQRLGFPAASTFCVPNALDISSYSNLQRGPRPASGLRLLSLGRIVDVDKGIFWLPKIFSRVADLPVHLTIAGGGNDLDELKKRCAPYPSQITFLGPVAFQDVPALFASHDALLMPSRFEGFGYTLIEALAARCVPVASRISGTTDFIVKDGENGLLFPIGDVAAAAACVRKLATDRELLERLSQAGPEAVRDRFSIEAFSKGFEKVIDALESLPPPALTCFGRPFSTLKIGGGWRKYVPMRLKNILRKYLYR